MKLTKDKINLMDDDELNYRVAKILGDVAPSRSFEGFMEHYAQELAYTRHWSLASEIVELYVDKLFRNVGGTWTAVMRDTLDGGQPVFTSFSDSYPLRAMVKCLILHHQEMNPMTLYTLENVATFRGMDVSNGEIDDYDAYDEALDSYGTVSVLGLEFDPSRIIKELDPTAYRCGYNDWKDSDQRDLEDAIENEDYSEIEWIEEPEEEE